MCTMWSVVSHALSHPNNGGSYYLLTFVVEVSACQDWDSAPWYEVRWKLMMRTLCGDEGLGNARTFTHQGASIQGRRGYMCATGKGGRRTPHL